jgi:hypothetical protein
MQNVHISAEGPGVRRRPALWLSASPIEPGTKRQQPAPNGSKKVLFCSPSRRPFSHISRLRSCHLPELSGVNRSYPDQSKKVSIQNCTQLHLIAVNCTKLKKFTARPEAIGNHRKVTVTNNNLSIRLTDSPTHTPLCVFAPLRQKETQWKNFTVNKCLICFSQLSPCFSYEPQ